MDNHAGAAAVRAAVERIQAERKDWQGVGLMAIEHLESGACGVVLVPSDAPAPNWSQELLSSIGPWERHEDLTLVTWLQRWHNDLSSRPDERWTEWTNLLRRHCPTALVESLPRASRQLAVGRGFGVHALPPAAADDLLGRLVAWALPWTVMTLKTGERSCCHLNGPPVLTRLWTFEAVMGAGGRDRKARLDAGGLHQWGLLAAWPSATDVVVAFLLAQADAMPRPAQATFPAEDRAAATPATGEAAAKEERPGDGPKLEQYRPAKDFARAGAMKVDPDTLREWERKKLVRTKDNGADGTARRVRYLTSDVVAQRRPTPSALKEWLDGLPT
jgi:hypothetical protein